MEKKHYGSIDGLRMIAAFGIVMMHMMSNNIYEISGFLYNEVIPSFTNFVFLFMTVSAFGMCCGYYEKMIKNQLSFADFYGKRFQKILPFFGILVFLDMAVSHTVDSLYEGFVDLTLMFGFLPAPGDISVIGVGWFLGLIFVFYLCFPFFCVLMENKKRAWSAFGISLIYNFACLTYFGADRTNILYSACYFFAGGLIYLYRNEISHFPKKGMLVIVWMIVIVHYVIGGNTITWLSVSSSLLMYAIAGSGKLLENKVTKFFSDISMEIYLSHMVIFRVIEKVGLNRLFGNGWIQYLVTVGTVLAGTTIFAVIMQRCMNVVRKRLIAKGLK